MFGLPSLRRAAARPRMEPTLAAPVAAETRAADRFSDGWGALAAGGAAPWSAALTENLSAVLGAVELISTAIAALPASIVQDGPNGRVPMPNAPAARILEQPNNLHSWPELVTFIVASVLTHGNALARVGLDGRGAPASLTPIPWPWVNPSIITGAGSGAPRLVFDVQFTTPEARLLGIPGRILDSEACHWRSRSDNGVIGRSVFARAAQVCREGAALGTLAESLWRQGIRPSAVLTAPQILTPAQREQARTMLAGFEGAAAAGRAFLLEGGFGYKQIGLSSVDAEFLATRRLNVEEIARITRVPVGLLQPGAGVQPYEAMIAAFGQLCLAPLVSVIESEFSAAVLPFGQYLHLDLSGMLRGNYSAVAAAQAVLVQSGIAAPNDARRALGLPAVDGGDALRVGTPPSFPADAKGVPSLAPKPGHGGTLPNVGTNQNGGSDA